eukprot:CAMPEP_0184858626 /NCGR_PEP_ID=MMETSP0580-20130426/3717_1 /TAXON_ID=1118495 /ORGANISM="Dactyliosolen fragilissimus" /LENGTH=529 /DNA_ID=CAMNT_0027354877 /DNA_START=275 /DNA_END=1864 /DNA_ORIENTATION=-
MSKLSDISDISVNIPQWSDLTSLSDSQPIGKALNVETESRREGRGSAHVQSNLRLFRSKNDSKPKITLFRDHAGWCPYCQKTMLLIEEKQIPIKIELVPMRSYGDKPAKFMSMVPNGLLPALAVEFDNGKKQIITESQVIMELLDQWHPTSDGYSAMLPAEDDREGQARYDQLARLERELFSWWCTLIFRPEGPRMGNSNGLMNLFSGSESRSKDNISGAMTGFLDCLSKVDKQLLSTSGPWFFDDQDHPTMIDFVYVSHIERMLASCAFWKGLDLRSDEMKLDYPGLNNWLDAFEKKEYYLAFKSDYYTHVMDIPPQYGPGYNGGFEEERQKYSKIINGSDGSSWNLPLPHDDPLQPLYRGPPLPLCVLEAAGIFPDNNGSYEKSNPGLMAKTCRSMAAWKLSSNGYNVSRFASRGSSKGSQNPRKTFSAQLADPYANSDESILATTDEVLRFVCLGLFGEEDDQEKHLAYLDSLVPKLQRIVSKNQVGDVASSLAYLRDRVGVPRDLPLAAARQLRSHLNWAIRSMC